LPFACAFGTARTQRLASRATVGHSPSEKRCSTNSISRPNTITSKLPLVPSSAGSQSCSFSFSSVISVAPSTAPHRWPAPPTTAMNSSSMPMFRLKGVGFTKRCMCA
jgi:hypothetical protein